MSTTIYLATRSPMREIAAEHYICARCGITRKARAEHIAPGKLCRDCKEIEAGLGELPLTEERVQRRPPLAPEQVRALRADARTGHYTWAQLGRLHGVDRSTARRIATGQRYRDIA